MGMALPKINTDAVTDSVKSSLVSATGMLLKSRKGIDEELGDLLLDVQRQRVYVDGKTFVDLVPSQRLHSIHEEYKLLKKDPNFDLREFVTRHFYES